MITSSQINPETVHAVLAQLNHAPYFLEQLHMQNTATTHRNTYSFGYGYFSLIENNKNFTHIPSYLVNLCQSCLDSFPKEDALGEAKDYNNVIVSIYEPGFHLEPHVDVDTDQIAEGKEVDFHFGEEIIGVILKADSTGKLYLAEARDDSVRLNAKKVFELNEEAGMSYLMKGKARHRPYYHGVSKVTDKRISVTFRKVLLS